MDIVDLNYKFRNRVSLLSDKAYFFFVFMATIVYITGDILELGALTLVSFFGLSLLCVISTTNQLTYTLFFFTPMYLYLVIGTFPLYNVIIVLLLLKRLMDKKAKLNLEFSFLLMLIASIEVIHLLISSTAPSFNTIKLFLIIFLICMHLYETPEGYSNSVGIKFLAAGTFLYAAAFLRMNQTVVVSDTYRLGGLGELDPNTYGLYNLFVIALIAQDMLLQKKRKVNYLTGLLIIGIVLVAGALTLSKTYFLTCIGMTIVFLLASLKNWKQFFALFSTLSAAGFLFSRTPYLVSTIEKILFRFELGLRAGDITTGRSFIMNHYIEYLQEHIRTVIFGEGMYSYMKNFEIRPHNTIIELIMSWGIVGGVIFLSLLIIGAMKYRQKFNQTEQIKLLSFMPALLLLIYSQSLTLLYQEATYVYIIIAVMTILGNGEVPQVNVFEYQETE